jgi:uncharacterized repeat protein (TIGR03803 family)
MRNSPLSCLVTIAVLAITLGLVTNARGQYTETTLYSFTGGNDGSGSQAGLIFDSQGNLYGTTFVGGPYGTGTVFRLAPQSGSGWVETVLWAFTNGTDGGFPTTGLTIDAQGNLYGTTSTGGSLSCIGNQFYSQSCGVVFQLSPQAHGRWKETVLHSFQSNGRDGFFPYFGGVNFDSTGNLYGTTSYGGAYNTGTVFALTPTVSGPWKEKILHSFTGGSDGRYPSGGLILDSIGNLYGSTFGGGIEISPCGSYGCGVVFKLTPTSSGRWNERILYSFTNGSDGLVPAGGLTWDSKGNLYGTAAGGSGGYGVLFQLQPVWGGLWRENTLFTFAGADGVGPAGQLIFDSSGNLYGTTEQGGAAGTCTSYGGCGAVFEFSPNSGADWTENVLYNFTGGADGCRPIGSLALDSGGNLYSTTQYSDCPNYSGNGTVFELSP